MFISKLESQPFSVMSCHTIVILSNRSMSVRLYINAAINTWLPKYGGMIATIRLQKVSMETQRYFCISEYGGKWKMLHYYANGFFAPTLISPYLEGNDVDVYIVLDELPNKEVRHPTEHTLTFKPTSNPRPFR